MDPSDDEVAQVVMVTSLDPVDDRAMIIQALKSNNRNVETVLSQYFDDPESFRRRYISAWDDSLFSADRDGSADDNVAGISFHIESLSQNDVIQGVTPPPPEGFSNTAPSRPPSRSHNRSPLGRMVDWTAGDASGVTSSRSQEEDDMQRALRESAQEAGITIPQQEVGISGSEPSASHFGPANRGDYEQGNWAMVPLGTSETKLTSAPLPSQRKRSENAPAFLVQGAVAGADHRLGGLLTILHQIPLARNILLQAGEAAPTYGFNSEWWNGQEILPPHVLAKLQTGDLEWGEQEVAKPEFEEEIHRIMAFLDGTERSYGTVSVLTDLIPYSNIGPEKQFYEQLGLRNGDMLRPLCQVASLAMVTGEDLGDEEAEFGLLEMEHITRNEYTNVKTLYEALDHIMWSDVLSWSMVHEGSKMAVFKEMGEALVIKLGGEGPVDHIEIPQELYPERYMAARKDEARRIQLAMVETKKAMTQIIQEEQNINQWKNDWNHNVLDKREMVQRAVSQWKAYDEYLVTLAAFRGMEDSGFDTDKYPDYRTAPRRMSEAEEERHDNVGKFLLLTERVLADMDERMRGLHTQLEHIQAKLRFLGRLLTDPNKAGRPQPMSCKKYLLRGVATAPDIVYVCQRLEPDLVDLGDAPKKLDHWWRLSYTPNVETPVKSEEVEIEQVLHDMWQETKVPLLIYATEDALNAPRAPLSTPLDRFVRADNKAFRQELNQETSEPGEAKKTTFVDPISPSKRKHRADSMDSLDSNRASIGSDDRGGFENPFEDQEQTDLHFLPAAPPALEGEELIPITPQTPPLEADVRPTVRPGDSSATMTPSTVTADEIEAPSDEDGPIPIAFDQSISMTSEADEPKGPEMKEQGRPATFGRTPTVRDAVKRESVMDLDMPNYLA